MKKYEPVVVDLYLFVYFFYIYNNNKSNNYITQHKKGKKERRFLFCNILFDPQKEKNVLKKLENWKIFIYLLFLKGARFHVESIPFRIVEWI